MARLSYASIWIIVLTAVLVAACGESRDEPKSELRTIDVETDDGPRSYQLYEPFGLDGGAAPLVVVLHGHGGSADQVLAQNGRTPSSRWLEIADEYGFAVAVPDGMVGNDGDQGWNDCRISDTNPDSDDVAFLEKLVEDAGERIPISSDAVFFTGLSNGGHMALRMAIERPELVSGIAAIAASLAVDSKCDDATQPTAVMVINGTDDPILPYRGGEMGFQRGRVLPTTEMMQLLAELGGQTTSTERVIPDTDEGDDSTVLEERFESDPPVVLLTVQGGGHTEPSATQRHRRAWIALVGPQNGDIETVDVVWRFFQELLD
ncbi:MAG: hypothetical protein HKN91_07315 [Acidimicrobiia bacterium]|nr:hypothetical protein [Acidimicrobiia bacterium]